MLLQEALGAQGQVATSEKDPLSSVILCEDTFPFLEEQGPSHWRENLWKKKILNSFFSFTLGQIY